MFSMSMKYSMIPYEPVLTAWHGAQIFNHAPMHPERFRRLEQGAFLVPCSRCGIRRIESRSDIPEEADQYTGLLPRARGKRRRIVVDGAEIFEAVNHIRADHEAAAE